MGTVITVDVRDELPEPVRAELFEAAERELTTADADFSTWRPDSWISRLAAGAVGPADCPPRVQAVLALAEEAQELTQGWFSPRWRGPSQGHFADPTGLVKGWAAQQTSDALRARGVWNHLVNAAGDVVLSGRPSTESARVGSYWHVGISDPRQPGRLIGTIALPGSGPRWAVASSGTAERGAHVTDPHTGRPATAVAAATVVADETFSRPSPGAIADACATALVAAGEHAAALLAHLRVQGLHGFVVFGDGRREDPDRLLPA
jgi:thiamine biosynthesis lipoprotein